MRKTYAYNSIIFGILVGIIVYLSTMSVALTVLSALGISVVGFIVIRMIENLIDKGVNKAADKISEAHARRKEAKTAAAAGDAETFVTTPSTTRFPGGSLSATNFSAQSASEANIFARPVERGAVNVGVPGAAKPRMTARQAITIKSPKQPASGATTEANAFCRYCGSGMESDAMFCMYCGSPSDKMLRNK